MADAAAMKRKHEEALFAALGDGDFDTVERLLHQLPPGEKLSNFTDPVYGTLLHLAVRHGAIVGIIQRIMENNRKFIDGEDFNSIKVLVERGGHDMLGHHDFKGQTPMHMVCDLRRLNPDRSWRLFASEATKFMVDKYPEALNVRDLNGKRPVDLFRVDNSSSPCGHDEETDSLVRKAAMPLIAGRSNTLPLHSYLHHPACSFDLARFLVFALRDQLSTVDENGDLPLHIVASRPLYAGDTRFHYQTVEQMLRLHPDACRVPNRQGDLPLTLMARVGKGWASGMELVFQEHPLAVLDLPPMNGRALCKLLRKMARDGEPNGLFRVLKDLPNLLRFP